MVAQQEWILLFIKCASNVLQYGWDKLARGMQNAASDGGKEYQGGQMKQKSRLATLKQLL